jgi:plasmid stability protein
MASNAKLHASDQLTQKKEQTMKINFDSATFQSLLQRANAEGKSIPKLVNEILTTVLTKEETNDKTEINTRS